MKKNSLDLNDIKPECIEIRDKLKKAQERIDFLKPMYDEYNNRLMLSKDEAGHKVNLGHELYALNIQAISLIQQLAMCQEGRKMEDRY